MAIIRAAEPIEIEEVKIQLTSIYSEVFKKPKEVFIHNNFLCVVVNTGGYKETFHYNLANVPQYRIKTKSHAEKD